LVVPRVTPRREQLIRAERFRDRGLVDVLHPQALAPDLLSSWVERNFGRPARGHVTLGKPERLRAVAREVLGPPADGGPEREHGPRHLAARKAS
jgi:predicted glycosyltransferase